MTKNLTKAFLITFAVIAAILVNSAFADEVKSTESKFSTVNTNEDPDLKLSIEELRKKYPISLLDEKKKSYKQGQKINIDDYSIEEIKAAFLNADRNFKDSIAERRVVKTKNGAFLVDKKVVVYNKLELLLIENTCSKLGISEVSNLNKKQQVLQWFVFSSHVLRDYINPFVSDEANHCFEVNDPLDTEDRN